MKDAKQALDGRIILVGNPHPVHVGAHLKHAAEVAQLPIYFCDSREAYRAPYWRSKFDWWIWGRRPTHLRAFGRKVVEACGEFRPQCLISIGTAPLEADALKRMRDLGVRRLNYSTDDPRNSTQHAAWFLKALPHYDHIFSTRRANLGDLKELGCHSVSHLPFAYSPKIHFPEPPATPAEKSRFAFDVVFVGGGDQDRIPYITALIKAGFRIGLYGGYWERFQATKMIAQGQADPQTLRKAVGGAKVTLGLVRRANRDGSSMRTFEIPAMGGCMLAEDTDEHRRFFGGEKERVVYFKTTGEMVKKLRWLLEHDRERERLAQAARQSILSGHHTYEDRLLEMLHP